MSGIIGDLGAYLPADVKNNVEVKHSTNKRAGQELDLMDYLQLMIVSLQNQTIDDTMSMSDMMNQMSTMSMMQAITNLNEVLSETGTMSYAASLVGKNVTVAVGYGTDAYEYTGKVTGVSVLDGEVVIFVDDEYMFYLSDVIVVGDYPSDIGNTPEAGGNENVEGNGDEGSGGVEGSGGSDDAGNGGFEGEDVPDAVSADRGTGAYYGFSFNENDFEYIQDANGALRIVYKGEDGASAFGMGVTEQLVPGGTAESNPKVEATTENEAEQSATQEQNEAQEQDVTAEQSGAGAEAAAAEWLAENG